MYGEFINVQQKNRFGTYEMERYCITYVWDDGEKLGVSTKANLTIYEAKLEMMELEKQYPSFVKHAIMAKMVEVIR